MKKAILVLSLSAFTFGAFAATSPVDSTGKDTPVKKSKHKHKTGKSLDTASKPDTSKKIEVAVDTTKKPDTSKKIGMVVDTTQKPDTSKKIGLVADTTKKPDTSKK